MSDKPSNSPSEADSNHSNISNKIPVVGIGASAGGLEAFKAFFEKMPPNTGIAFVLVPHLDPEHKSLMVEIIARYTSMPVLQVEDRTLIEPDHIYIVQPNYNLIVEEDELAPSEIPRGKGINLPVDIFFRSLAVAKKELAIGVILSGTMRDGAMGLKDIKEHGGLVIAQSPETAQHDGMPQSAIDTGMVDFVLPIEEMPDAITKLIAHPYIHGESLPEYKDDVHQVLAVIQARTKHDFRCYKPNTLVRRIERRMGLLQIERMSDYVNILKTNPDELESMLKDLQSSNEELETSKEELHSMNEELNTVNAELREKVNELEAANNDIANLMNSTDVATVFLDVNMEIRRFTPAAKKLFNLIPSDVGRPISDLSMRFNGNDLQQDALQVMETLVSSIREVSTDDGSWYIRRILPFRTQGMGVDGLVLTFSDVTELKEKEITLSERESQLKESSELLSAVLEHTHMMAVYLDPQFNFIWVNRAYAKTCGYDPSYFPGKNHFDLYPNEENEVIFKRVAETGDSFFISAKPFEFPDQPERGITYWDWSLIPTKDLEGKITGLVFTLVEVTDVIRAEEELREREAQYRELVQNANSAIIRWKVDGSITFFNEYAQNFFGYEENEILGKDVRILLPDEDSDGIDLTGLAEAIVANPEQFKNNVNENICKNGTRVWMAWTNKPVFDEHGGATEILAVGTDITALKDAETALIKSENEKSLILENADELIAYHDKENNLVWANKSYLEATGKSLPDLQGRKCFHCWGLDDLCNGCPVTRAIETGRPQSGEITPENQVHWPEDQGSWDVRSAPVRDSEGKIIGAIEIARNITERKKAEEAVRALSYFPAENPNPVLRCIIGGELLYANTPAQNWLKELGWHPGESLPASILKLVEAAGMKSSPVEVEMPSSSGQIFQIIGVLPPGEEYVNLYGVDITGLKKAETALQKMNDLLEQKVMERTAELEWRNRELQEFAYVASHDLQEPLRKIKLFEEMLEKELKGIVSEKGHDYMQRMNRAADRMQKLVKALLAYSRSSSKTSPFERVNLKQIIEVITKDLLPEDEGLIPVFEIEDLPEIDADPVQMHQLFQNLLSNAVHYHKEGQAPEVKVSSYTLEQDKKRKTRFCELKVEDNGIGFDMAYVDKIFLPFERLHANNKYDGTGMGLAICRKIAERHGGQISASSKPGEGAIFTVTLPVRQIDDPG